MNSQSAKQLSFELLIDRPVVVQSSAAQMTNDAGLLPIREFDRRWQFPNGWRIVWRMCVLIRTTR